MLRSLHARTACRALLATFAICLLSAGSATAQPVREMSARAVDPARGPVAGSAIVHGSPVDISRFPWLGVILNDEYSPLGAAAPEQVRQYCGATLVAPAVVLTAAHCFTDEHGRQLSPAPFHVVFGRSRLDTPGGQTVEVSEVIRDPEYDPGTYAHDVALLVLSRAVDIAPAQLAGMSTQLREGQKATIVGWGVTDENGVESSSQLLGARVPVWSNVRCYRAYDISHEPALQLCAARRRGGVDTCYGDSGGPIIYKQGGAPVILGVVSFGNGCARKGWPGIYAWVASPFEQPWILRTVASRMGGDPDRTAPALTGFGIAGGRVSYDVSERSLVVVAVQERIGRGVWLTLSTALLQQAAAGTNGFAVPQTLRGHPLGFGRYRLRANATDAAGNRSAAAIAKFTIS